MANISSLEPEDHRFARRRFGGPVVAFLMSTVLDVREMRKIEQQVLEGSDETVMAFKSSHLNNIGMIAVASAIISQLSMTTLQLTGLSSIHWSAAGFIIASLLFGVIGVMLSCMQQQILGTLNNPEGVRMWLSNGKFYPPHDDCHPAYDAKGSEAGECAGSSGGKKSGGEGGDDEEHPGTVVDEKGRRRKLQVSLASLQLLSLPPRFLACGVLCFLTGFGLFLGFAWRQDLADTPARDNNEAVLVLYVVVVAVSVILSGGATVWKMLEVNIAEKTWEKDLVDEEDRDGKGDEEEGNGRGGMYEQEDNDDDHDNDSNNESDSSGKNGKKSKNGTSGSQHGDGGKGREEGEDDDDDNEDNERTALLGKKDKDKDIDGDKKRNGNGEAKKHDELADALEQAAKAHRKIARLMRKK